MTDTDETQRMIIGAFGPIQDLEKLEDEDTLFGAVQLFGVRHYVYFVKVEETDDEQVATNDPHDRLGDVYNCDPDGAFRTVKVPGHTGDYVTLIYPGKQ